MWAEHIRRASESRSGPVLCESGSTGPNHPRVRRWLIKTKRSGRTSAQKRPGAPSHADGSMGAPGLTSQAGVLHRPDWLVRKRSVKSDVPTPISRQQSGLPPRASSIYPLRAMFAQRASGEGWDNADREDRRLEGRGSRNSPYRPRSQ